MTWSRLVILAAVCALWPSSPAQRNSLLRSTDDDPDRDLQLDRSPTSRSSTCRRRCACRSTRARSASRIALRVRSGRATSVTCSRISSASTTARRSASSIASASCEARRSASTARATGRSSSSRSTARCSRKTTACSASTSSPPSTAPTTSSDSYSPALGVVLSRELGSHGALYFEPIWVNNSNQLPSELTDDNDTFLLGLGGRLRIRPTVYLVGEYHPADRIRARRRLTDVRHREARWRPRLPAQFLERLRDDDGATRARRNSTTKTGTSGSISRGSSSKKRSPRV